MTCDYCKSEYTCKPECAGVVIRSLHALIAEKDSMIERVMKSISTVGDPGPTYEELGGALAIQPTSSSQKAGEIGKYEEAIDQATRLAALIEACADGNITGSSVLKQAEKFHVALEALRLLRHPAEKGEGGA